MNYTYIVHLTKYISKEFTNNMNNTNTITLQYYYINITNYYTVKTLNKQNVKYTAMVKLGLAVVVNFNIFIYLLSRCCRYLNQTWQRGSSPSGLSGHGLNRFVLRMISSRRSMSSAFFLIWFTIDSNLLID